MYGISQYCHITPSGGWMRGWSVLGSVPLVDSGVFGWSLLNDMAPWLGSKLTMDYFPKQNAKIQT